jgi:hypothetical protein
MYVEKINEIENTKLLINELQTKLDFEIKQKEEIRDSKGWKFILTFREITYKAFPINSKRRDSLKKIYHLIKQR